MHEIYLFDILDFSSKSLVEAAASIAGIDVANQLENVIIPVQMPSGSADNFSILALAYPRLTPEDKKDMELVDEISYRIICAGINVRIELDQFKRVNWIHIEGGAHTYERLMEKIRSVVEAGGNKYEWQR